VKKLYSGKEEAKELELSLKLLSNILKFIMLRLKGISFNLFYLLFTVKPPIMINMANINPIIGIPVFCIPIVLFEGSYQLNSN
ncbi:MAG: hypothetical protein ACXVHY_10085, partial [Methanobacterium sp.]